MISIFCGALQYLELSCIAWHLFYFPSLFQIVFVIFLRFENWNLVTSTFCNLDALPSLQVSPASQSEGNPISNCRRQKVINSQHLFNFLVLFSSFEHCTMHYAMSIEILEVHKSVQILHAHCSSLIWKFHFFCNVTLPKDYTFSLFFC